MDFWTIKHVFATFKISFPLLYRSHVHFPLDILDIFGWHICWKMSFSSAESGTTTYSLPICRCIAVPYRDLGKTHRLTVLPIINSVNLRPGRRCCRKCVHGVFWWIESPKMINVMTTCFSKAMSQLLRAPYVYKEPLYVNTLFVCDHVS